MVFDARMTAAVVMNVVRVTNDKEVKEDNPIMVLVSQF